MGGGGGDALTAFDTAGLESVLVEVRTGDSLRTEGDDDSNALSLLEAEGDADSGSRKTSLTVRGGSFGIAR
ncbi:hypothetical protein NEOLI_004797 [Neolecta irregularis DAH-3]|uniref:Uncharacterized protein n=1 Tax=Neolecta irregularis (strain DAH-3) TaxID=1198029 RepID=A0A1U7LNR8_NEOID|nr:hypothetical protein NEOLI_004797 [Neolecta irregularis DAH-3]|eukprot:OLL24279.1 hypothetical protein NEOLI_004797 [Neolecta irregularis DAH-3]